MSTIANPITSPVTGSTTHPAASASPIDPLASESTFLTLLVSQLQNQDPLSPVDSNQFVSQLTSYSQLEQLIGIHKDTTSLSTTTAAAATAPSATTPTTSGSIIPATTTSTQTGAN
jgi:flagellar basal-body rod modification protein FlgD